MLAVRPRALTARAVGLPFSSLALHLAFTFPPRLAFARAAPWCEGQNLEGADLAPDAMRDAGLSDAVKSLGLSFTDRGDVDFTSVAPSTNHYSIGLYREWLSSNPTANFATWMRKRETNKKKKSGESTMARKRSYETALHEQSLINVVNAELIGDGLRLVHDAVHAAVLREGPQKPFVLTVGGDHSIASASISALLLFFSYCYFGHLCFGVWLCFVLVIRVSSRARGRIWGQGAQASTSVGALTYQDVIG